MWLGFEAEGRRVGEKFSVLDTPAEDVIRTARTVLVQGSADVLRARYPSMVFHNMRSVVMAPLIFKNEVIGLLNVRSLKENAYGSAGCRYADTGCAAGSGRRSKHAAVRSAEQAGDFPDAQPEPGDRGRNLDGSITYCNPIARQRFPNLTDLGPRHPIMKGY